MLKANFYFCPSCLKKMMLDSGVVKSDSKIISSFRWSKSMTHSVVRSPLKMKKNKNKCSSPGALNREMKRKFKITINPNSKSHCFDEFALSLPQLFLYIHLGVDD